MLYTEEDIARFRAEIEFYGLSAPAVLAQLSDFELTRICNGWGPDDCPRNIRRILTAIAGCYAVLAVPHDVRFKFKIGTRQAADLEFYQNGIKIWKKRWGWKRFIKFEALKEFIRLRGVYRALQLFSKNAWEKKEKC